MAGYPHIRYISSGLDGTSFRGPFRGNFEVCNKINEIICNGIFSTLFNVEREYMMYVFLVFTVEQDCHGGWGSELLILLLGVITERFISDIYLGIKKYPKVKVE